MSWIFDGNISYPKKYEDVAHKLAKIRSELSSNVYKEGSEKYRGDKEHWVSVTGILAELVARHYLVQNNIKYKATPFIDIQPIPDADLILEYPDVNFYIDVKGVPKQVNEFRVNYDAHKNEDKLVTHYWFVKFLGNQKANLTFFEWENIEFWKVKQYYTATLCRRINGN